MESKFDGGLLGLIGHGLLAALVTIFTLGIGTPWAICIMYGWQTKHTIIDGKRLSWDGKGIQLLGTWIKWLLLTIITLGIYSFWISIKLKQWIVKHQHFAD